MICYTSFIYCGLDWHLDCVLGALTTNYTHMDILLVMLHIQKNVYNVNLGVNLVDLWSAQFHVIFQTVASLNNLTTVAFTNLL